MKKWIVSIAVFLGSFVAVAAVGLVLAIVLVGPHSDMLPNALQIPVGILIWAAVIGVPVWLSRKTYIRYTRRESGDNL